MTRAIASQFVHPRRRRRRKAFNLAYAKARVSAFLVSRPADVGYLTGFSGEDSFLLLGAKWASLITDGRYGEQASSECPEVDIVVRRVAMFAAVAQILKSRRIRSLAVQAEHFTLQSHHHLSKAMNLPRLKSVTGVVDELRIIKDSHEIQAIRRAVRVAETAFKQLLALGAGGWLGRSERDIAGQLEYLMRLAGGQGPSFETIVAAGANGSKPHYRPGGRKIRRNEAVLIDWGAVVDGYCSDLTRVVFTGKIPPKLVGVYELVCRAQKAGISAIRPGVACKSPDKAARDVIQAAGYGDNFAHSLGHGLGRCVHESPALSALSKRRLRAGMVVTVEPGIYLPGIGGVRIEDDILVTRDGPRRLSTLRRDTSAMVLR